MIKITFYQNIGKDLLNEYKQFILFCLLSFKAITLNRVIKAYKIKGITKIITKPIKQSIKYILIEFG